MYISAKSKRLRKQRIIWTAVTVVLATPMIIVLIIGAALSMAGCASPDVVCTFDWGVGK